MLARFWGVVWLVSVLGYLRVSKLLLVVISGVVWGVWDCCLRLLLFGGVVVGGDCLVWKCGF